ncbi:MAG TPA: DUF480 domain-containing protein [Lentisphaeria bacterium]|nr:MAG: hypothetical protein A2X48_21655 [Lentisphaerae bacterium GWF2_49_21]HBC85661.1 DUF480 domain-containing protein [Lentisphaeria bacterium]
MPYTLTAVEARVLGCLIEKQFTTPDVYPLSLNSLTLACNQKSNRDPVMELQEESVVRAADSLRDKNLSQMVNQAGSRVMKYSHDADRTLSLDMQALALLCELLVRGPQTPGELRGRASRMTPFESIETVEKIMNALMTRQPEPLVVLLPRQPGRKESRYAHLLSGEVKLDETAVPAASGPAPEKARMIVQAENERMDKLETEITKLREDMNSLKTKVDELKKMME